MRLQEAAEARGPGRADRRRRRSAQLDRDVDRILEKRRWLLDRGGADGRAVSGRRARRARGRAARGARRAGVRRAGAGADRRVLLRCRCWPGSCSSLTDFDIYAIGRSRTGALRGLRQLRARCSPTRCSGRRSATRSTSCSSAGRSRWRVSLGAALLLNARLVRFQALFRTDLLRAGGDHAGGGGDRLALPLPPALRPAELGARRGRRRRRSTGSATRTGRCRRSSCWRCGRTSATTCSSSSPGCRASPRSSTRRRASTAPAPWQRFRHVTLPSLAPDLPVRRRHDDDRLLPALRRALRDDPGRPAQAHHQRGAAHVRGGLPLVEHGLSPRRSPSCCS